MSIRAFFFMAMSLLCLMAGAQNKRIFSHYDELHSDSDFLHMREHKNETPWQQSQQEIVNDDFVQSKQGNEDNHILLSAKPYIILSNLLKHRSWSYLYAWTSPLSLFPPLPEVDMLPLPAFF